MQIEIEFSEKHSVTGDTLKVMRGRSGFYFEIDEPWAGCTETGFGQTNHFDLTDDQARELLAFLAVHLAAKGTDHAE